MVLDIIVTVQSIGAYVRTWLASPAPAMVDPCQDYKRAHRAWQGGA